MKRTIAVWILLAGFCSCAKNIKYSPLPVDRLTYTLKERSDGRFVGVHGYHDGTSDTASLFELKDYIIVSPGWWGEIHHLCEIELAKPQN